MLVSIVKYHATIRLAQSFSEKRRQGTKWYKVHHLLMIFFLVGYLVVLYSIINDIEITNDIFTSLIFFFGASFVLIGILLQVSMLSSIKRNHKKLIQKNVQVTQAEDATIYALAYLSEIRDKETGEHIQRTAQYVRVIVEELSIVPKYKGHLTQRYMNDVVKSAPLHDIGKVGVPDGILNKPGKLTAEEFDEIKKHSNYGAEVLETAEKGLNFQSYLKIAIQLVRHHHERWDGSGYPGGLSGDDIPLSAQIMAIADVYDALRSERCYKKGFSHEKTCDIIEQEAGKQFSPDLVDAFKKSKKTFEHISSIRKH